MPDTYSWYLYSILTKINYYKFLSCAYVSRTSLKSQQITVVLRIPQQSQHSQWDQQIIQPHSKPNLKANNFPSTNSRSHIRSPQINKRNKKDGIPNELFKPVGEDQAACSTHRSCTFEQNPIVILLRSPLSTHPFHTDDPSQTVTWPASTTFGAT